MLLSYQQAPAVLSAASGSLLPALTEGARHLGVASASLACSSSASPFPGHCNEQARSAFGHRSHAPCGRHDGTDNGQVDVPGAACSGSAASGPAFVSAGDSQPWPYWTLRADAPMGAACAAWRRAHHHHDGGSSRLSPSALYGRPAWDPRTVAAAHQRMASTAATAQQAQAAGLPLTSSSTEPDGRTTSGAAASSSSSSSSAMAAAPPRRIRSYYDTLPDVLRKDIMASAARKQTGVSLQYILDFGAQPLERQMLLSARFLHAEIPIRLAHRIVELDSLPRELHDQPQVQRVKGWYAESFRDMREFPAVKDMMDSVKFTAMLKNAFRRHNNVVPAIAKGVEQYKRMLESSGAANSDNESVVQHFLDTFFLSRIALRFLAGHHIAMFEPPRHDHIGLVHTQCKPVTVAADAVAEARSICFREYGSAPGVTIHGNPDLTMAYIPSHLHHMVFELVKNSLRAVQDKYQDSDAEPPPIRVVLAEGLEDVTIKISDQGGGIPRSGVTRIWTYLYTTARSPLPDMDEDNANALPAVLAGYGCGLPLSRLYAKYFGGDLQIISMEGYGTDAYLHLDRLGNDEEPLPGQV